MRKVIVSKMVPSKNEATLRMEYPLVPVGEALFHGFGADCHESSEGFGNYTAAIVEWPDGKVELVPAQHIQFVKDPVAEKETK